MNKTDIGENVVNDFQALKLSLARSMITGDVIARFYEILLGSHPDIKPRFSQTNFDTQKHLLRQSIGLAILFANDKELGKKGIERIRKSHNKSNMNIPPRLYPFWKQSFIQAVSEFDHEISAQLEKQWDFVLQKSIDYIIDGYES